jgi:putative ABC transport system ATP-binding protein
MNASQQAVVCQKVQKVFRNGGTPVEVLRGVDLEVPFGEISLLVGPSGCGKTTLLSVIAGLLTASGGELRVLGREMRHLAGNESIEFRRKNLGFVFQQYNLLPSLTAAENAAVPLLAASVKRKEAVERARHLLNELGMEQRAEALPRELSGGQQQRVALARALIHEPRLLVCDEPTSALHADTGQTVMELLRNVAVRKDRALIVVTHDSRIFDFADRIAYMNDGRIVRTEVREKPAGRLQAPSTDKSLVKEKQSNDQVWASHSGGTRAGLRHGVGRELDAGSHLG